MKGEMTLPWESGENPRGTADLELPLIYIASPLTRANDSDEERRLVGFEVDKIVNIVQDPHFDGGPLKYRTHAPAVLSAPWISNASSWQIFRKNTLLVLAEADALIVLSLQGGSAGTGQEIEMATQRGLPILYLVPQGDSISRQIEGNPLIDCQKYDQPDELDQVIRAFINRNKSQIDHGPTRRRNATILYSALQEELREKWVTLSGEGQNEITAQLGLEPAYLDHYLSSPLLVATMAHNQLLMIGIALGVDVPGFFTTFTRTLSMQEISALVSAKEEYEWSDEHSERLLQRAERLKVSDGVRRLLLNSPADWKRLKETLGL
ncbi:hypothetical protein [Candidatus Poriferisocius sp.]|uniref:hypothetical protein n=1 Tax=Candidatus Poriferisocius sp. TaxID=3101276 RepID=UPI003B5AB04F